MRRVFLLALLAVTILPAASALAEAPAEKQLAQKIGSHLKESGMLHDYRVAVKYHDGVAYLTGSVASSEQRDTAARLAQQVQGVSHVVCKLEYPSDSKPNFGNNQQQYAGGPGGQDFAAGLSRASYEGAPNDQGGVSQAFQPSGNQGDGGFAPDAGYPQQAARPMVQTRRSNMPVPAGRMPTPPGMMPVRQTSCPTCNGAGGGGGGMGPGMMGGPMGGPMGGDGGGAPMGFVPNGSGRGPNYDNPQMPGYAWPSYASYPNYAALQYPQQYSPSAWPYIGPFYPYPQVPLAWRKVSLEWDDGWWFLDFSAHNSSH